MKSYSKMARSRVLESSDHPLTKCWEQRSGPGSAATHVERIRVGPLRGRPLCPQKIREASRCSSQGRRPSRAAFHCPRFLPSARRRQRREAAGNTPRNADEPLAFIPRPSFVSQDHTARVGRNAGRTCSGFRPPPSQTKNRSCPKGDDSKRFFSRSISVTLRSSGLA